MHRRLASPQQTSTQQGGRPTREVGQLYRRRTVVSGALTVAVLISACSDAGSSDPASTPTTTAATAAAAPEATTSDPIASAPVTSSESQIGQRTQPLDASGLLDVVGSTEADIGDRVNYVADQVDHGRYDGAYRARQDGIEVCSSVDRPLLLGATYDESVDGRGWLYVDLDSPQVPYVAHSVMVLTDDAAARAVMDDLRAADDLPGCVAEWVADVNGDDPGSRNAPWRSSVLEYTATDAAIADPLEPLGTDQIAVTWQQHLTIDGVATTPEDMSFFIARFGSAIFTFSGNDRDRTATAAGLLAERITSSIGPEGDGLEPASEEERIATVRARRQAMADAALLRPEDLGEGWRDDGPETAFPMTAALAASVPSCTSFVDVVFDGNAAVWAHTALGRDADLAFTSVAVFATDDEAAAMVAATNTAAFDECWADFNEVAVLELPYGIASATYASVEPPAIELDGDSWSLHALEGTLTLDSIELADTCVCAFVQKGRTVVTFHSAAPVFSPAERRAVIATAVARISQEVE